MPLKRIFIISPYSHADPKVREERYEKVLKYTHYLLERGDCTPYSPIIHGHTLDSYKALDKSSNWWVKRTLPWLEIADEVHVLHFEGFSQSSGCTIELNKAETLNKDIVHVYYEDIN